MDEQNSTTDFIADHISGKIKEAIKTHGWMNYKFSVQFVGRKILNGTQFRELKIKDEGESDATGYSYPGTAAEEHSLGRQPAKPATRGGEKESA